MQDPAYTRFKDSGTTEHTVTLLPGETPDSAELSISVPGTEDFFSVEAYAQLTVFDAIVLREALDQFIAQAVGANV